MKRCALITAAVCVAVGTKAPRIAVAADASPVVVAYRAPSECPSAEVFRQYLQRRLHNDSPVELLGPGNRASTRALLVQVDVHASPEGFAAQLSLRDPNGQSSPRSLSGPKCVDLIEALAFTAALSVEQAQDVTTTPANSAPVAPATAPNNSAQPGNSAQPNSTQPNDSAQPISASPTEAPSNQPTAREQTRLQSDGAPKVNAPVDVDPPPAATTYEYYDREPARIDPGFMTWSSQASAGLTFTSPLNTSLSPGLALGLQFNGQSASGWSPALGLSVQGSFSPLQVTNENASFAMLTGQAYVCPGALHSESWTVRLCGVMQLGTLHGEGENLDRKQAVNARLSSAGLVLTANYFFAHRLFIGGQLGALLALDQHRFEIGSERRVVAETRTVAPWLSLDVGTTL